MSDRDFILDRDDPERRDWQLLHTVAIREEAALISGLLESEGIESQIESLFSTQEPVNFGLLASVRVWVRRRELARARQILAASVSAADAGLEPEDAAEAESLDMGENR